MQPERYDQQQLIDLCDHPDRIGKVGIDHKPGQNCDRSKSDESIMDKCFSPGQKLRRTQQGDQESQIPKPVQSEQDIDAATESIDPDVQQYQMDQRCDQSKDKNYAA